MAITKKMINNRFYRFKFDIGIVFPENFSEKLKRFKKKYTNRKNSTAFMLINISLIDNEESTYWIRFIKGEFWKIQYLISTSTSIVDLDPDKENIWNLSNRTIDDIDENSFFSVMKIRRMSYQWQEYIEWIISNASSHWAILKDELELLLKDMFSDAIKQEMEEENISENLWRVPLSIDVNEQSEENSETNITFWLDYVFSRKAFSELVSEVPKKITYNIRRTPRELEKDILKIWWREEEIRAAINGVEEDEEFVELKIVVTKKENTKKMFWILRWNSQIVESQWNADCPITDLSIETSSGRFLNKDDYSYVSSIEATLIDWLLSGENRKRYITSLITTTKSVFQDIYR